MKKHITWAEFVECSKKYSCPNCEIRDPEKCRDECMECYAAYVEWTVREGELKEFERKGVKN